MACLAAGVVPGDLTPEVAARVDRLALARDPENLAQLKIDFQGNVVAWAGASVPFSAEEEAQRSAQASQQVLRHFEQAIRSRPAEEVFERLVAHLPERMRPGEFRFQLVVLRDAQPGAFTVGGGRLFITTGLVDTLLSAGARGRGMLAFVLAHELGHVALGHCRRGYQWQMLVEQAQRGLEERISTELASKILKTTIDASGGFARFLYTREQEYEADLFAWHLCRNSGVPPDQALDAARYLCLLVYPQIATDAGFEPRALADRSRLAYYLSSHPDPLRRLQRLWHEARGTVPDDPAYGLYVTNRDSGALERAATGVVPRGARAVVFLHGMEGGLHSLRAARSRLAAHPRAEDLVFLTFWYPNDQSLARSGEFLFHEIERVGGNPAQFDFVCHSAGGLVFRYYAQVKRGTFGRVVFLATPHGGSDLARLRPLLEAVQFAREVRLGFPEALQRAVLDGQGQIMHDLLPGSLFLRYLDQQPSLPLERCHVIRGSLRRRDQAAWLAARAGLDQLRPLLRPRGQSPLIDRLLLRGQELLEPPDEITRGDLCVALERAVLPGLPEGQIHTLRENHATIKENPRALALVEAILLGNGAPPE